MNYALLYLSLIDRARSRSLSGYRERHHVKPRCLGGSDESENIVELTAREHFVAHQLLVRIFPGEPKLVYAARMMCADRHGRRSGNREYEWLRRRFSAALSIAKRGNAYKLGTKHSDETRRKISEANKGNQSCLGRVHSKETKAKIAAAHAGKPKTITRPRKPKPHVPYSSGETYVTGIRETASGAFLVRKTEGKTRVYKGFFWSLADAKAALGD